MYCGNAAAIAWEEPHFTRNHKPDHDAVVCVTFLLLPLVPLRPCHVFDHSGTVAREVPLRWSGRLLFRALVRPWLVVATALGGWTTATLAYVFGHAYWRGQAWQPPPNPTGFYVLIGVALMLPVGLAAFGWLRRRERRDVDIRLVIGRYAFGSSDPATWHPDVLRRADLRRLIGSPDAAGTAETAFRRGHFSRAMLAARLLVARGDPRGEALTARLLADPRVEELRERIRRQPWRAAELAPEAKPASPQAAVLDGILFYDKRRYPKALLDQAGGPGFAAFVRDNPRVVRAAPSHVAGRAILWALLLLFAAVALGLGGPDPKQTPGERLLGGAIMCAIFGWILRDAHTRVVTIADGWLSVANQRVPLDAVDKVKRERFLAVFPGVSAYAAGQLVSWPYREGGSEELERILEAAIALRRLAPCDEGGPAIRADGASAHIG